MLPGDTLLNRYYIERQIGQRLGRLTLLVIDQETQQRLVLKVLSFGPQLDWQDHKLFEREAALLKAVQHPAIPQYVDFFELDLPQCRGFALAQTYIEAPSLREWVQRGRSFSTEEIEQIAQAVLQILTYLHAQHPPVVHRDIKPSNILLSDRTAHSVGSVYLVDFGAVQTLSSSGTQTVVGSYGYMPMEQFGGRAVPASDLYSLGATLIELLTGRHPADFLNEYHQFQIEQIETLPLLKGWLRWLTQPHPQQRPPSAQVALEALRAIAQTEPSLGQEDWIWQLDSQQWVPPSTLRRWQKPQNSQVILAQYPNHVLLTFPPPNKWAAGCALLMMSCFMLVWNSAVIALFKGVMSNFSIMGLGFALVFGSVSLGVTLCCLIGLYDWLFLRNTEIRFGPEQTDWHTYYRCGPWRWKVSKKHPKPDKLVYVPSYLRHNGDKGQTKVKAQLEMHWGVHKEAIEHDLSELELQWLTQELSEKLEIPCEYVQSISRWDS